jgi:asparagine synthase (glutamine-hydrolysing)
MCGIAGFIDLRAKRSAAENDRLAQAMGDAIRHRGPDAGGVWSDPDAGLWFSQRRLAIVDLSEAGSQPMATPDGRAIINYNGEIYNAPELRPELEAAGYRFRGHSDTEVLLYGCRHWGVEATLRRLIGMFASPTGMSTNISPRGTGSASRFSRRGRAASSSPARCGR